MTTLVSSIRTASLLQQRATTYRSSYQRARISFNNTRTVFTSSGRMPTIGSLQRNVKGRHLLLRQTIPYNNAITTSNQFHRTFTTLMPEDEIKKRLDEFQELFVEARYCIEDATDAADSTYFDEEAQTAKEAVDKAVETFDSLINDIQDGDQKNGILRSNGLKVEQLKGELQLALSGGH